MIEVEPSFLYSIRNKARHNWQAMVCELIDNSINASAKNVRVSFLGGNVFRIEDDGIGTPDLMRLVTLGKRHHHEGGNGRYGVGCKEAIIWMWGTTILTSETADAANELTVHWEDIACGDSPFPTAASITPVSRSSKTGTCITCYADRRPAGKTLNNIRCDIGATYTPAIEDGVRIRFKTSGREATVLPRAWPQIADGKLIEDTIIAAGREVRIKMGIVAEGATNTYCNGFSFEQRGHRVIKETSLGAHGLSVSRIAARISLGREWEVSTNKDDLLDFTDELGDAIYERCADLMCEASEQAISIEDAAFARELANAVLANSKKKGRENRNKGETSGTAQPANTGRRRRQAARVSGDGEAEQRMPSDKQRRGFTVEGIYWEGKLAVGKYDADGNRVVLNLNNRWVHRAFTTKDTASLLPAIELIIAKHDDDSDGQRSPLLRPQIEGELIERWGVALDRLEGKKDA